MARTKKGSKAPGYDYWSRRPVKGTGSAGMASGHGPEVKRLTHRSERRQGKTETHKAEE
jgi:hypothetical protein